MTTKYLKKFRTDFVESERGWGQKVDGHKDFDTLEEAREFVKEYNSKNNLPYVPDWYVYAATPYEVFVEDK